MPSEVTVHAVHKGAMRIDVSYGPHTVELDYPTSAEVRTLRYEDAQERRCPEPDQEACAGFTPLQLLLASLAGCAGNTLALLLARTDEPVKGIEVDARAQRRDEHPTVYTQIDLEFTVRGTGIDPAVVERSLAIADKQLCPVWAMLKPGTPIAATYRIADD